MAREFQAVMIDNRITVRTPDLSQFDAQPIADTSNPD